jgi:hypothetical protein
MKFFLLMCVVLALPVNIAFAQNPGYGGGGGKYGYGGYGGTTNSSWAENVTPTESAFGSQIFSGELSGVAIEVFLKGGVKSSSQRRISVVSGDGMMSGTLKLTHDNNTTVYELDRRSGCYAADITVKEKGTYLAVLTVEANNREVTFPFSFEN